jgi:hypothetical protein
MESMRIIKAQPVDDFIHRSTPGSEVPPVKACDLQRAPQAFGRCIDAPMSNDTR